MCRPVSLQFLLLCACALLLLNAPVQAQTPSITEGVPAESPLGEQFCFDTNFENTGPPGFGPYLRLELPPELAFDSASLFSYGTGQLVRDLGVFPPAPGNELEDTNIGELVTGTPDNRLLLITLPLGAVIENGPDLVVETCLTIDSGVTAGDPLPIIITPVYRFGDSATGAAGPIIGTPVLQEVVPVVLFLTKTSTAPESERPPGATWAYDYVLNVDIANGATVSPVTITDTLPPQFQFDGTLDITGGASCNATTTPSLLVPGGDLVIECTGVPPGTTAPDEIVVTYGGYINDVLSDTSCVSDTLLNLASAAGDYQVPAGGTEFFSTPDSSVTVSAKHIAAQKAVTPATVAPDSLVVYSLDIQVTEFGAVSSLVVVDTLPDGVRFDGHGSLTINGIPVGISPTLFVDADFTSTVTYDITAVAGTLPAGSSIALSFNAVVQERYSATNLPVLAGDPLNSPVSLGYDLAGGASQCGEGSNAAVQVAPAQVTKELINPQSVYRPGDPVVFRLTNQVSAGSSANIRFADFLPLPVLLVTDLDLDLDIDSPVGSVSRGPDDTAGLDPASITVDTAQNVLLIDWPDLDSSEPEIIQVDVTAIVSDEPFADGLFLTNVFSVSNSNTNDEVSVNTDVDALNIAAPLLGITKGVLATDGLGVIAPSPAVLPVDGDLTGADGNDIIDYLLTVENTGNAQAFEVLITDPGAAGLTACNVTRAVDGDGNTLTFTGAIATGITLTAPLNFTDGTPGAPYSDDTALITVSCQVDPAIAPNSSFTNEASVSWVALPGAGRFPDQVDDASGSTRGTAIEKLFVATSEAGTRDDLTPPRVTIGEIARYRLVAEIPEGRIADLDVLDALPGSLQFLDDGTARAAFISNGGLSTTGPAIPNIVGDAADITSVPSASITFPLAAVNNTSNGQPFVRGHDPRFELGDVTNGDSDANSEFIVIEFNAVASNVDAFNRNNTFAIFSGTTNLNGNSNVVQVRRAEPVLTVSKTSSITEGDAGDPATYTIEISNANGNNISPAYDVVLSDLLPAEVTLQSVPATITPVLTPACGAPAIGNTSSTTSIDFTFSAVEPNCQITITFDVVLNDNVAPGGLIENTATVTWTSLPGPNGTVGGTNLTGSVTPGASGAIDGERNNGTGFNDYIDESVAPIAIPGVGIIKTVLSSDQGATTDPELLIGEQATFEIVVTVPEGVTTTLQVNDTLPFSNGVMRLDAARVIRIGTSLEDGAGNPLGAPAISQTDDQLGDGIADTALFDFGAVTNVADNDDNIEDRIILEVDATLVDVPANTNGDQLTNTATVAFGTGLSALATATVDVVEALLSVQKTGDSAQGDAGDVITYTVTISHTPASAADAFDLALQDILIADLGLDLASIQVVSGPAFELPQGSAGNTVELVWSELPLGDSIELEYQATLSNAVQPGQGLANTVTVDWNSTEEDANDDERDYAIDDDFLVTVTPPGVSKAVTGTSIAGTGDSQFGPADDLTIGEEVTYRITVTVPEGTSANSVVTDQLPTGTSVLEVISSELVTIGASLGGLAIGEGDPGLVTDSNGDSVNDLVTWNLGTILNSPDDVSDDGDLLIFEVVAVVRDLPLNQSGPTEQLNRANARLGSASNFSTAPVNIVAPELTLDKTVSDPSDGFVDAGDLVTVRLAIAHSANSTADSYANLLEDTLPAGLSWVDNGTVSSTCAGLVTDSSAEPLIAFTIDELVLTDGSCTIDYVVRVDDTVQPGQQLQNMAMLAYDSTPVFAEDRTRQRVATARADVVVLAPTLVKLAVDTSQADTTMDQGDPMLLDLTIGETVTYEITIIFPEGVTPNVVLTDVLPASANGVIEVIGAQVSALGGNLGTTAPGTPDFRDDQLGDGLNDTVEMVFGDITNAPDGLDTVDDRLVVRIVGRVVDVPANVNGQVLTNNAFMTSDTTDLQDSADVEVVEPELLLSKNMTLQNDGVVRITLEVENTGTAPAYDLQLNDVLDEADWLVSGLAEVSVANGFALEVLAETPAAGQQTVRLSTADMAVSPAGTIPVGSSISATFDVPLAVLPPDPNPLPNEVTLDAADTLPGDDPAARDLGPLSATDDIALPQLELLKTAELQSDNDTSGTISAGDTLRYTLTLENIGQAAANNLVIDDVPDSNSALVNGSVTSTAGTVTIGNTAGEEEVQVTIGTLGAGDVVTIIYDTLIDNPLPAGVESVINQAVVDSDELPPQPSDDPTDPTSDLDPTVVPIEAQPDLTLSKDDGGVSTSPGGVVTWTLAYRNVGTQDATGVTIEDLVPDNTVFQAAASDAGWACVPGPQAGSVCTITIGDLAVGDSGTVSFAVLVDDPVPAGVEQIANSALVADDGSNGPDPTPDNNVGVDQTPLDAAPDLQITKDDGGVGAEPGELLAWTLQINNVGVQDATGVIVTDTVPDNSVFDAAASSAGWNCPGVTAGSTCTLAIGDLAAGAGQSLTFTVRVDTPLPAGVRFVENTASVADDGSNGADPTPDNNSDSDSAPVGNFVDLAISKSDGGVTAVPGQVVVYTLNYENQGAQGVTGAFINEVVPLNTTFVPASSSPGWVCAGGGVAGSSCVLTLGDLAGGAQGTVSFGVRLDEILPETVTSIANIASIGDDGNNGTDINPANNQDPENTPTDVRVALALVKSLSDAPDPIVAGSLLEYTLVATNTGTSALSNVVVSDSLITPTGGSTPCALLAPMETCTLVGTYLVLQSDVDLGRIDNTGTAVSDQTDMIDDALSVPLEQNPGLSLTKTASLQDSNGNALGDFNEVVNYELVAVNGGDVTLDDVIISDPLLGTLSCTPMQPATLLPGATLTCTGSFTITGRELSSAELVNTATVTGQTPSGQTLVDDDSASVPLAQRPAIAVPVMNNPALALLILLMVLGAWRMQASAGSKRRV